ncbi:MAG: hypothetical protein AB7O62_10235 [Pirellulales bacterium]
MVTSSRQFQTLEDLREYVSDTLCQIDQLEPDAFPITQRLLVRRDAPCGVYFCLHGPRAVKFSAIWDAQTNNILFYSPNGERIQKTEIVAGPTLEPAIP